MFGRDPWGGTLEISNADSATDDDRSRDLDRGAMMRHQLDETQQSWLLAGPGDQAGKKKKKYVDIGCMVIDRKIFMWTVGTILGVGLFIGFIMMIVKLVPHKKPPPPPPDEYTLALHKALMFFNAQRCEFINLLISFGFLAPAGVQIPFCLETSDMQTILVNGSMSSSHSLLLWLPAHSLFLHLACPGCSRSN
jgi:hypothetical protein